MTRSPPNHAIYGEINVTAENPSTKAARARAASARYRQRHPERVKAYERKYCEDNKEVRARRTAEWRRNNPEKYKAQLKRRSKRWIAKHPDYQREYYAKNKERKLAANALWRAANMQIILTNLANRRALKRRAIGKHTAKEIAQLYEKQRGRCAYCSSKLGAKYHRDHILSLNKGGSNRIDNIQLLCATCNCSKKDADPFEYARRIGRLL